MYKIFSDSFLIDVAIASENRFVIVSRSIQLDYESRKMKQIAFRSL